MTSGPFISGGKTKGRHLWLRNNASTIVSQAIDTVLFTTLAFAGKVSGRELVLMMTSVYGFKVLFALLDTPFCYLLVKWCKASATNNGANPYGDD